MALPACVSVEGATVEELLRTFDHIDRPVGKPDEVQEACDCSNGACSSASCVCIEQNRHGQVYTADGRLIPLVLGQPVQGPVTECSTSCPCEGRCPNSVTQQPIRCRLVLRRLPGKGWSAFADELIPAGAFVCLYLGEYVTSQEARRRLAEYDAAGGGAALLTIRQVLPSGTAAVRVSIDATRRGNIGRFFNHACDGGNLEVVLIRSRGCLLPSFAFFARRDIQPRQELTYSYGSPAATGGKRCCCGTPACLGFLPNSE